MTTSEEYLFTAEGCYITELSNIADDPEVSIARARVEPNVTTTWHRLNGVTERYCIISGEGVVEIGENPPKVVVSGDVVIIPPMTRQRISNTGKTDLIFLAICSPRFTPACYETCI
ncbi:MAG: cupin domain-containing protein [Methylotenera sp.]|jgi:mannose-6-phosphate isomerase-like protein (cupin superfamily)